MVLRPRVALLLLEDALLEHAPDRLIADAQRLDCFLNKQWSAVGHWLAYL